MTNSRLEMDNNATFLKKESVFVCEVCNRNFIKLHRLKSHLRTHKKLKIAQGNNDAANKKEYSKQPVLSQEMDVDGTFESHFRNHKKPKHVQVKQFSIKPNESSNLSSAQLEGMVIATDIPDCQDYDNPGTGPEDESTKSLELAPSLHHTDNNSSEKIANSKSFLNTSENCTSNERISPNQEVLNSVSSDDILECDICGRSFKSKCYLDRHYLTHTKEKPHVCDVCGKGFAQKGNLNVHYLTHSSSKNYVCYICDKPFAQMGALKAHLLTHSKEMPHACHECGRKFTSKCFLDRHYLIHTGEKPHKCNICNKGFAQLGNLNVHYLTHTKEKLFYCAVCNKGFSRQSYAERHLVTHSKEQS